MYAYPVFSTECLPELASIIYSGVFKGLGHEMGYFLKALKDQICTFFTCVVGFQAAFLERKINIKISLASMKKLLILKKIYRKPHQYYI